MELQRIVGAQTDIQTRFEEVRERVPLVSQEKSVVAERAHGNANLFEIEQVLESRNFA